MIIGIDGNEANVKNRVGSGQYAYELLKQFADNKEHKFVIYLKDKPFSDLPQQSENFTYKIFGPRKFWTQFALPIQLTVGQKPDVFFSMAHYGPRFSRVPYVVTIHDLSYLHFPELFKKDDLYQLTAWSKYSINNAKHIIAVSRTTKDDIVKKYHIEPSKITVTYEGYDQKRFKAQPRNKIEGIKKKYKIEGDYVIFVGTLQPRKNIERLIEAFASIVNRSLSIVNRKDGKSMNHELLTMNLVIVGKKGWLYDSIFQKIKTLKLEDKVIFTDFIPDEDVPPFLAGAKTYVLPSLWEGFGIPVIEAQACGVPVVVSNTSSLPEIVGASSFTRGVSSDAAAHTPGVGQAGSGILIDPLSTNSIAQGIQKAMESKTRSDLVKKGFQNIKRFSWQKCADETISILTKVASK